MEGGGVGDAAALVFWVAYLVFSVLVGLHARSYGRSAFGWTLLSLVFSPVAGIVFLLVAGDTPEFAGRAAEPADPDVGQTQCLNCGASVDWATMEGLHAPEDEPWALTCDRCGRGIQPAV
jgi:hypothetical protein